MILTTTLIVIGALLATIGLLGVVLPMLPGAPLMFAGFLLIAWAEDFREVGATALVVLGVLTALTFAVDYIAGAVGAQRMGASRLGLLGAAVGTIVGIFFFPVGLLLGPFLGALAGELIGRRDFYTAGRVGVGAVVGTLLGAVGNLVIAALMVGVFLVARFGV